MEGSPTLFSRTRRWPRDSACCLRTCRAGQFAKAEPISRSFLEQARQQFGTDDPRTVGQMAVLGSNLLRQRKYNDAEPLLRDCLQVRQAKQPDAWNTFNAQSLLG